MDFSICTIKTQNRNSAGGGGGGGVWLLYNWRCIIYKPQEVICSIKHPAEYSDLLARRAGQIRRVTQEEAIASHQTLTPIFRLTTPLELQLLLPGEPLQRHITLYTAATSSRPRSLMSSATSARTI